MMNPLSSSAGITAKLYEVNWLLVALVVLVGLVGVLMIFAATDGVWSSGAQQHLIRLIVASGLMLGVAMTDVKVWYALAYPAYFGALVLLIAVDVMGVSVNGSQRWLDLQVMRIQPSEVMKLAIVLAMARYYHDLPNWRVSRLSGLLGAAILILLPMALVLRQPDLGTTLLLAATGVGIIFLAGVNWRVIGGAALAGAIALPLFFRFGLKEYQRSRILTFLDPSRDPTGASYHITQSKIALGSGGFSGKGFMNGTQRQLAYVPENRTDFIFTVIGEEFGLLGSLLTIGLYILVISLCVWLSMQCKHVFSRLLVLGLTTTFTLYIFINLGMVMGLAPVVGVPLPLISYGGTVVLTVMTGFGLILSAHLHRQNELPRSQF
ncbi:rod shape-determining protein RodA [Hellea sp.]|nr:rod shape-determining protein RodA [Hellea sp.]